MSVNVACERGDSIGWTATNDPVVRSRISALEIGSDPFHPPATMTDPPSKEAIAGSA
jgi:hypothetical protein